MGPVAMGRWFFRFSIDRSIDDEKIMSHLILKWRSVKHEMALNEKRLCGGLPSIKRT
jgi:hypothetical protein